MMKTRLILLTTSALVFLLVVQRLHSFLFETTWIQDSPLSIAPTRPPWQRNCTSPEIDKPWIFGTTNVASRTSDHMCGLSGTDNSRYVTFLARLSREIQVLKEKECAPLIVYGVAFGSPFDDWLTNSSYQNKKSPYDIEAQKLLFKHGHCFLTFVLADSINHTSIKLSLDHKSKSGISILVPVHRDELPYKSLRRNTKIFKMMGQLLFPWAKRIIWEDAKLKSDPTKPVGRLPTDYFQYFDDTINQNHVCASFIGLPMHPYTMGLGFNEKKLATLAGHCSAINEASIKRPTVSDDMGTLMSQCAAYQTEISMMSADGRSGGTLDGALIDSAFMVWDMRSNRCRNFAAEMSCTWLDEIHCYSDRDQVSFPQVILKMGLQEIEQGVLFKPSTHDRLFAQENHSAPSLPLIHITKSNCHWYYKSLRQCKFSEPRKRALQAPKLRVAIVVAGSFRRFIFQSSVKRLLQPLVAQGHQADYFLSIVKENAPAYRANSKYMNHLTWDPIFGESPGNNTIPEDATIEQVVRQQLEAVGARLSQLTLGHRTDLGNNALVKRQRDSAQKAYNTEDPDFRFPVIDLREGVMQRTSNANRNMLSLFLSVQHLWQRVVDSENENSSPYDYVLFLRDDTLWLDNFDINRLLSTGPADLYIPSCDARDPTMDPSEINDHIAVVSRSKAEVFGKYFEELFNTDLEACGASIDKHISKGGQRGCNSEMILRWILTQKDVSSRGVGQSLIPFQRSAQVTMRDGLFNACFHKHCQSHEDGLPDNGMKMCKHVLFR